MDAELANRARLLTREIAELGGDIERAQLDGGEFARAWRLYAEAWRAFVAAHQGAPIDAERAPYRARLGEWRSALVDRLAALPSGDLQRRWQEQLATVDQAIAEASKPEFTAWNLIPAAGASSLATDAYARSQWLRTAREERAFLVERWRDEKDGRKRAALLLRLSGLGRTVGVTDREYTEATRPGVVIGEALHDLGHALGVGADAARSILPSGRTLLLVGGGLLVVVLAVKVLR